MVRRRLNVDVHDSYYAYIKRAYKVSSLKRNEKLFKTLLEHWVVFKRYFYNYHVKQMY